MRPRNAFSEKLISYQFLVCSEDVFLVSRGIFEISRDAQQNTGWVKKFSNIYCLSIPLNLFQHGLTIPFLTYQLQLKMTRFIYPQTYHNPKNNQQLPLTPHLPNLPLILLPHLIKSVKIFQLYLMTLMNNLTKPYITQPDLFDTNILHNIYRTMYAILHQITQHHHPHVFFIILLLFILLIICLLLKIILLCLLPNLLSLRLIKKHVNMNIGYKT